MDDDPAIPHGLMRALHDAPYRFIAATSATEALEVLRHESVDVVVSDEQMPEISGSEFLSYVRRLYPSVIRIILTGHTSVQSALKAINDGWIYQYLHKPCDPMDLVAVIHNALVLRSFMLADEGPHLLMPADDQEKLLEELARRIAGN